MGMFMLLFMITTVEVYSKDGTQIRTIRTTNQDDMDSYDEELYSSVSSQVDRRSPTLDNFKVDDNVLDIFAEPQESAPGILQLQCPSAIAVNKGILYVTDNNKYCVQKVTTSGEFVSKFGEGHLSNPRGICIDCSSGRVFVSSSDNNDFDCLPSSCSNCVAIFEADGTFVNHFTNGNLNGPWGLALDNSGNLHVASTNTSSIVVFTREGEYVSTYNSGVKKPAGIAIDDEGNTFVTDCPRAPYGVPSVYYDGYSTRRPQERLVTVVMLNTQHEIIASWQAGHNVTGITLDKEGSIYVCDYSGRCVRKY